MRRLRYEHAFEELLGAAQPFGIDMIVENPTEFLKDSLKMSHHAALNSLKELERRGLIGTVRTDGESGSISRVRLIAKELPGRFHEVDSETRLVRALWRHRRPSQENPGMFIVHSLALPEIKGEADVVDSPFYVMLENLEKKGWIAYHKNGTERILFVALTGKFPSQT